MAVLPADQQIAAALVKAGLLTVAEQQELLKALGQQKVGIDDLLLGYPKVTDEAVAQARGSVLNIPYVNLRDVEINRDAIALLPKDLAENYHMVIYDRRGDELQAGLVDPTNFKAIEALEFLARKKNLKARYAIISATGLAEALKMYGDLGQEVEEVLDVAEEKFTSGQELDLAPELTEVTKSAPISKIISVILRHAVEGGASDIHIEPEHKITRVRYRIDGILHTSITLPLYLHAALVARVKVLANLKIDETRVPQDGRIRLEFNSRYIDFRVSTMPLLNQEKVVMRILDTPKKAPTLEDLGFWGRQLKVMQDNSQRPDGMFLVTGPTGSGKSTTLFSLLNIIKEESINICTLEDPIEYYIEGVNQSQVKPEVGFTFATGLRSLLRQDPDVIMVGEIRDSETAALATHAALTGHLVLSTLHTNDALGAIPRLIDMKVEPFLLSSTLNVIEAQRLVRKLCQECKVARPLPPEAMQRPQKVLAGVLAEAMHPELKGKPIQFYKGQGCKHCSGTGYQGRLAVTEVIEVTDTIRNIMSSSQSTTEISRELVKQEFVNLEQDGVIKAALGLTTLEEVLRVTNLAQEDVLGGR
jgi:type IV pilus assembly protein PilB